MQSVAFAASLPLRSGASAPLQRRATAAVPRRPRRHLVAVPRAPPIELKKGGGGGSKRAKKSPKSSSPAASSSTSKLASASSPAAQSSRAEAKPNKGKGGDAPAFPGPLAPEVIGADGLLPTDGTSPSAPPQVAGGGESVGTVASGGGLESVFESDNMLPVADESRLKLPDLGARDGRVRRKRKGGGRLSGGGDGDDATGAGVGGAEKGPGDADVGLDSVVDVSMPSERVAELARAYRMGNELGGADRQAIIDEIEKEPDFLLKVGEAGAAKEYDLTSALFGRGRPNKQGIYVLPYLQSGHILLLGIGSLIAFVYYPGFPLTEASEEVRLAVRNGIVLALSVNLVLAYFAGKLAAVRNQPQWLWVLKTMALGDLAYGELRRNTRPENDGRRGRVGKGSAKLKAEKRRRAKDRK